MAYDNKEQEEEPRMTIVIFYSILFSILGSYMTVNLMSEDSQNFINDTISNETNNTINQTIVQNHYSFFHPRKFRECSQNATKIEIGQGTSMEPFLFEGDIVYYDKVPFEELEEGDVILFNNKNGFVIHAIKGIYRDYIVTQGYNNPMEDLHYTYENDIRGRYCVKNV